MNYSVLREYNINYEKGIARCMDDAALYERVLGAFLEDEAFEKAKIAIERKEYRTLFECMHELKGACGNADFTDLFACVVPLVECLRKPDIDEARVAELFARVRDEYEKTRRGVQIALGRI